MLQVVESREELERIIKESNGHLIVVYSTKTCGYCRLIKVELEAIAEAKEAQVLVFDITNANDQVSDKNIVGVPYIEFYKDGQFLKKEVGYKRRDELTSHIIF